MLQFALMFAAGIAALIVLDKIVCAAMRCLEPLLPNELAGRGGWFVDTHGGTGIFDRKKL